MRTGGQLHCLVNRATGREIAFEAAKPVRTGKRIAVIGGGPAGLTYASLMAGANEVALFERANEVGGAFRLAGHAPLFQGVAAVVHSKRLGYKPRVAMLAFSTFGYPESERSTRVQEAVKLLDQRSVDFEYDGEMGADVALNPVAMANYPFCRLTGPANVLVMPAFHAAAISTRMVQELGGSTVIGPLLVGLDKAVQIVPMNSKDSDIVNMAALAAAGAGGS